MGRRLISVIALIVSVALAFGTISAFSWVPSTLLAPFLDYQHIERADDGFALGIPPDWEYVVAADAHPDEWWDHDKVDDTEEFHEDFVDTCGLLMARRASPVGALVSCFVFDESSLAAKPPRWTKLKDAKRDVVIAYEDDPEVIDLETTYMDLPAGRVLCVDRMDTDGWDDRSYYFKEGRSWFSLQCGTHVAPEDRWLSIAETFEFLPDEA